MSKAGFSLLLILMGTLSGCFIAPLKVAYELEIVVVDAQTGSPIPQAQVIHLACDVHDVGCNHGRLIRTSSDVNGEVNIESKRQWGFWIVTPGGLPVPDHLIAVWAPGYSAFVFSQYGDDVASRMRWTHRADILGALREIPTNQASSDETLNPKAELIGGKIKLRRIND